MRILVYLSLSGPIGMFSPPSIADLASFQYDRDDEEGKYSYGGHVFCWRWSICSIVIG